MRDKALLEGIKNSLRVGQIYNHEPQSLQFVVKSRKDFCIIIKFFRKYKLQTQKRVDYEFWMEVCEMIERKEHLTPEGLHKIIAIRASMNRGLSDELSAAFPSIVPVVRPLVENPQEQIIDPNWLAGFTSAEGSFLIKVTPSKTKVGQRVQLVWQLTQDSRDAKLMVYIKELLGCGNVYKNRTWIDFKVTKFDDIQNKIIPFFKKYAVKGIKSKNFDDFCKVAYMMKEKKHLTKQGLEQIKKIKAGMNTGRKWS